MSKSSKRSKLVGNWTGLALLPVSALGLTYVVSFFGPSNLRLPTSMEIIRQTGRSLVDPETISRLIETLTAVGLAILLSVPTGIVLGLLLGFSNKVWRLSQPTVDFYRSIPVTFLIPVLGIILSPTDPKIIWGAAIYPCVLIMLVSVRNGIEKQEPQRLESFRTISGNSSRLQMFFRVTLWEILPDVFTGLKLCVSYAIIVVTVLEYASVGGGQGLGLLVSDESANYRYAKVYALIFLVGLVGFCLNRIVESTQKKVCHWINEDDLDIPRRSLHREKGRMVMTPEEDYGN